MLDKTEQKVIKYFNALPKSDSQIDAKEYEDSIGMIKEYVNDLFEPVIGNNVKASANIVDLTLSHNSNPISQTDNNNVDQRSESKNLSNSHKSGESAEPENSKLSLNDNGNKGFKRGFTITVTEDNTYYAITGMFKEDNNQQKVSQINETANESEGISPDLAPKIASRKQSSSISHGSQKQMS